MPVRPPRSFHLWLSAATLSSLGDAVLAFALAWLASGHGPATAAVVGMLVWLPRVLLLLLGGAAGDRWGPRRLMVVCDAAMVLLLVAVLLAWIRHGPHPVLLAGTALVAGIISAFSMPSASAFPRAFAADDQQLPRLLAQTGSALQLARLAGPPLGGVLLAAWSLGPLLAADALTFLLLAVVLLVVRPPRSLTVQTAPSALHTSVREGLRAAWRAPMVSTLLGAVTLVAAAMLPTLYLTLPLLARHRGWTAGQTGLVEGAWVAGTLAVTLVVAARGAAGAIGPRLVLGVLLGAAGLLGVATLTSVPAAVVASVLMGVGTAVFTCHLNPLLIRHTPGGMVARFQALLALVQSVAVLLANGPYALLADHFGPASAAAAAGALCASAAVLLLRDPSVRHARLHRGAGELDRP